MTTRRRAEKPLTKQAAEFVIFHLADKRAFAPFTGTDHDAWNAYIPLVRLWGRMRDDSVVNALRAIVNCAQTRQADVMACFKKAIPCLLDWSDERKLWLQIGPRAELRDTDIDFAAAINAKAERVFWPCIDGPRICHHDNSKPDRNHPGYLECKDCGTTWKPASIITEVFDAST